MLPAARLFLAFWATTLAGVLFAQDAYSVRPAASPSRQGTDQRSLAQQYLAAPGWASASDDAAARAPVDSRSERGGSTYTDQAAFNTGLGPQSQPALTPRSLP
ncbi:MAG: hypothetical protein U1E05_02455, partial [Patescibacteria group bacterium]|nr:hypothetical protein [Patescibacteria group bacterium]